jgi:phage tail-like protein
MANDKSSKRKDPLTTHLFGLKLTELPDGDLDYSQGTAFFKSISGLSTTTDAQDYQEGGVTTFTRKVIGQTKWANIVLKGGFTGDMTIWNWKDNPKRLNGIIVALGPGMQVMAKWEFQRGYPVKWDGPDLDASKNELAIESLEIAHEGLLMVEGDGKFDEGT